MPDQVELFDPTRATVANGAIAGASGITMPGAIELGTFDVQGSADGEFDRPGACVVDELNNVYVVSNGNDRIQKFDPTGAHLLTVGSLGDMFSLTIDTSAQLLYLCCRSADLVRVFDYSLSEVDSWAPSQSDPSGITLLANGNLLISFNDSPFEIVEYTVAGVQVGVRQDGTGFSSSYRPRLMASSPTHYAVCMFTAFSVANRNFRVHRLSDNGLEYQTPGVQSTIGHFHDLPISVGGTEKMQDGSFGGVFYDATRDAWLYHSSTLQHFGVLKIDHDTGRFDERLIAPLNNGVENFRNARSNNGADLFLGAQKLWVPGGSAGAAANVVGWDARTGTGVHAFTAPAGATLKHIVPFGDFDVRKHRLSYRLGGAGGWTNVDPSSQTSLGVDIGGVLSEYRVEQNVLFGVAGVAPIDKTPVPLKLAAVYSVPTGIVSAPVRMSPDAALRMVVGQ